MKKLFALTFLSINIFFGNQLKADWTHWWVLPPDDHTDYIQPDGTDSEGKWRIYTVDNKTGEKTLKTSHYFGGKNRPHENNRYLTESAFYDESSELLIFENDYGQFEAYDPKSDSWSILGESWRSQASQRGSLINRYPPIRRSGDTISIGDNSFKLKETETEQQLYGTNADGEIVPINITNGSKLLINGVEVTAGNSAQVTTNKNNISTNTSNISTNSSNIKTLGEGVAGSTALTAALTALPQTSKESKISCGVGTGAYSNKYALGFGCASKVNERVDVNAGGSYVFGGSKSYGEGTLDSGVIKAGFVFKLGELKKSTQISMREKEELKQEISDLKANNMNIISQNKALLARLERLEKVALGESKSKDLATIKLP